MIRKFSVLLFMCIGFPDVSSQVIPPNGSGPSMVPPPPDYSKISSWAALPFTRDRADTVAGRGELKDGQEQARADVFFIHPTSFTFKPEGVYPWNGDITNERINRMTDEGSMTYQASVFNEAGKIYAPRYRQAHYQAYFEKDSAAVRAAFEVAYSDVKAAFEYYLHTYNQGRPIIIASHSQGSTHAIRLVREYFDNQPLDTLLVCAYMIGMPVFDTLFQSIKPCRNARETGCFCSWQTYAVGYFPEGYVKPVRYSNCTNPLTWKTDSAYAPARMNLGGNLRNLEKIIPHLCDARVSDGVLRIHKPHFFGRAFLRIKNYHIGDYSLFYLNLRKNASDRVNAFLGE